MKTIELKLYTFEELPPEVQKKVLREQYDITVDCDWWRGTYEDAKRIGLKITGFDTDRGSYCNIDFIDSVSEICCKIVQKHGENTNTYLVVVEYLKEYNAIVEKYSNGINKDVVSDGNEISFDNEIDDLDSEFKKDLENCYLSILRNEYEYLTSIEAIKETILLNEYTFEENGTMRNY